MSEQYGLVFKDKRNRKSNLKCIINQALKEGKRSAPSRSPSRYKDGSIKNDEHATDGIIYNTKIKPSLLIEA